MLKEYDGARRLGPYPPHGAPDEQDRCLVALETEHEHQGLVDGAELVRVEAPGGTTEALGIDDGRLLDEDARLLTLEGDRGPKARWAGTRRRWRDEDGAQVQELISLDDDRVASPALFVAASGSRRRQTEDLAPDHLSRRAAERARRAALG
jgi:hypothetical protein